MKNFLSNSNIIPISVIVFFIVAFWYLAAIPMNSEKVSRQFKNLTFKEHVDKSWNLKKPKLPTPHQIVNEIIKTTFYKKINSKVRLNFANRRVLDTNNTKLSRYMSKKTGVNLDKSQKPVSGGGLSRTVSKKNESIHENNFVKIPSNWKMIS